jgi:hypothetical protein
MGEVMVDWNVRFGDLLVVASLVGTCLFYAARAGRFAESIANMQEEIKQLKDVTKELSVIVTQQAVATVRMDSQGERLNILDKRLEDLRHGQGFVRGSRGIEKEYP